MPPRIPDYELLRRIGAGSYGDVWIARTATGLYRAVKVVWRDRFEDAGPYEREFRGLREFERVSLVQPRQLALLHVARRDEDGFFYYVMELADDMAAGREIEPATYRPMTLRELRRRGGVTVQRTLELGVEMARGLAVLHDHGLVHRDIKPSNVVLVGGVPKLADVGLVASATMALTFVGTEGFVAPEGPGAPAADVYALGKVLYELVTGLDRNQFPELPEDFATREDRLAFLELNAVILRACEPDLRVRHDHARMLLDDLLLVQAGKSVRRLWAAERGLARTLKVAAILALVAAVAGAGAWVAWNRAEKEMALRAEAEAARDALAKKTQYAGLLAQASRGVERGDAALARRGLQAAREVIAPLSPGFEWDWLWEDSWGGAAKVLQVDGPPIHRVVLSPDGRWLATADATARVCVYDVDTGEVRGTFDHIGDLGGWSADGRWLLGVDERAHALAVEVATGQRRETAGGHGLIWPLGTGREGTLLSVEARGDGRIVSFDPTTVAETVVANLFPDGDGQGWTFFRHAMASEGGWVAVAWVRNFGVKGEFCLTVVDLEREGSARCIALPFRPGSLGWVGDADGRWAVEVADDLTGAVGRWEESFGDTLDRGPNRAVGSGATRTFALADGGRLRVSPDGSSITAVRSQGREVLAGHGGPVTGVVVDGERARLYSTDGAGGVLRWDLGASRRRGAQIRFDEKSEPAVLAPDGSKVYLPIDGSVAALATDTLVMGRRHPELARVFAVTEEHLLGVGSDGRILVEIDLARAGEEPRQLDLGEPVIVANRSRAGRLTVVSGQGSYWVGGDLVTLRKVGELGLSWAHVSNADATKLWMGDQEGVERVVSRSGDTVELLWEHRVPARAFALVFDEVADELYASLRNGEIWVFDATTGGITAKVQSGASAAFALALSPDRERLVVAGPRGELHVLDRATRLHLGLRQLELQGILSTLLFDGQGDHLVGTTYAAELVVLGTRP